MRYKPVLRPSVGDDVARGRGSDGAPSRFVPSPRPWWAGRAPPRRVVSLSASSPSDVHRDRVCGGRLHPRPFSAAAPTGGRGAVPPPRPSARPPRRGLPWLFRGRPAASSHPREGGNACSPFPPPMPRPWQHQGRQGLLSARATDISPTSPSSTGDTPLCPCRPVITMIW